MAPLRYSINVTLDGCCDHRGFKPDAELHLYAAETLARADGLLFGRVTYEMMESAWRQVDPLPDWMEEWMVPFARTIGAAKKYVVSSTLEHLDWNAQRLSAEHLERSVRELKEKSRTGLYVGGVRLPTALAELGLIDEYEFIVRPGIAGHGPTLFAGLPHRFDLKFVGLREFKSGAVALSYVPAS